MIDSFPRWQGWFVVLASVVLSVVSASGQPWVLRQTPNGILSYRAVAGDANECVAVGTEGVIISRKTGGPWAPEGGTGLDLNDIVRGPDEFVAVGASGKVALFVRTEIQYGMRTSSTVGNGTTLNSIAWNGSRYMIVGNDGVSYRSSGSSASGWGQVTTGTTKHLYGVGWTGSYWVAVGQDGTILRASSTGSWSAMTSPTTDDLRQLATGGGVVAAVGERGVVVTSSTTAFTWTRRQYSTLYNWWDVVWDGGKFLATADFGLVFASVDGVSWTGETRGVGTGLRGIAMAGGTVVAVGDDTVAERGETSWKRVAGNPAAGGPIQRMNGQFVMPVVGGTIAFSDDGHTWEEVAVQDQPSVLVTPSTPHWRGLIWTGTRYVGAGPDYLYASEDGRTWSKKSSLAVIGQYRALAWNGELAVAVGSNGFLQTSTDGLTWTTRDTGPAEEDFADVLWTGTRWLAVGLYRIFSSEDGISWSERYSSYPYFLRKLQWTGNLALVTSSAAGILGSADGLTWTTASLGVGTFPPMGDLYQVDDRWLAYAYGIARELYASEDGGGLWSKIPYAEPGEWVDPAPPNSQISRFGTALWGFENDTAIPLGDATPRSRSINDLHWDGSQVIAVGSQGTIRRSTDGITWRWYGTSATEGLYGVTKSDNIWVAVGSGGRIVRSEDGRHWEVVASGSTALLYGVAWTGSLFVAVGANGSILTSPDGLAWIPRNSGVTIQLLAVASNGRGVVVTGISGNVLFSPDGITWSSVSSAAALTTFNLPWVLWTGSHFVSQTIQSTDGLNWEHLPEIPPIVAACGWNGHEFLFGGSGMWRSTDLTDYSSKSSGSPRPAIAIEWMGDRWIVAGNGGGIMTSGGYSSWQETEGIPAWKQVAGGDANADGVPDLIAYASGLPGMTTLTAAQRATLPKLTWEPYRSRWEFQFSRLSQVPPGLRYHIEESSDLRTWNRLGSFAIDQPWPTELGISDTGPMFSPTHTVGLPISFFDGSRFWRLQVDP